MNIVNVLSIIASCTTIITPFVLTIFPLNKDRGNNFNVEVNINGKSRNSETVTEKKSRTKNKITDIIYNNILDEKIKINKSIQLVFFMSILLVVFNFMSYSLWGKDFIWGSYIENMLESHFTRQNSSYFILIITFFSIHFSLGYFLTLFIYDKKLTEGINNNISWIDLGLLQEKLNSSNRIKMYSFYPKKTISRINKNKEFKERNLKRLKKNEIPYESFFNDYKKYGYFIFIFILGINIVFSVFFNDSIGNYYFSKVNKDILFYEGRINKDERVKLLENSVTSDGDKVFFEILRKNKNIRYKINFQNLETIESKDKFTQIGRMENRDGARLRLTPYGPRYDVRNVIDNLSLSYTEEVRVHKNSNFVKYDGWVLILKNSGEQGFVYKPLLKINP